MELGSTMDLLPFDFEDSGILKRSSFSRKKKTSSWFQIAPPILEGSQVVALG